MQKFTKIVPIVTIQVTFHAAILCLGLEIFASVNHMLANLCHLKHGVPQIFSLGLQTLTSKVLSRTFYLWFAFGPTAKH